MRLHEVPLDKREYELACLELSRQYPHMYRYEYVSNDLMRWIQISDGHSGLTTISRWVEAAAVYRERHR